MFEPFSYLEKLVHLRKTILEADASHYKHKFSLVPHFVSANLSHMLPEIPKSKHLDLTKEIYFHQQWSRLDEQSFFLRHTTDMIDGQNVLSEVISRKPYIFCTFHMGSYRLLNSVLTSEGVKFSLVVDRKTLLEQGPKFENLHKDCKAEFASQSEMSILNAEDNHIALKAIRLLKSGKSLVFYIDGNTGVGGVLRHDDKMTKIDFLGQSLYARKGIAFLSHVSQVPLVPVICERTGWLSRKLIFYPAIQPSHDAEREEFSQSTTQKLFHILEAHLKKTPEQWEGWFYVHKFLDTDKLDSDIDEISSISPQDKGNLIFNENRYAILQYSKGNILFDKLTYRFFPLSEPLKEVLNFFHEPKDISNLSFGNCEAKYNGLKNLLNRKILLQQSV